MVSNRWIACQQEAVAYGTADFDSGDDPAEHIKPGIVDDDFVAPWNKQEHVPIHDITSVIPVTAYKKEIKVEHEINYDYVHAGVFRRFFGAASHADNVSTFTLPAAYSNTIESWTWNYRHGAKAFNLVGGVTQQVSVDIQRGLPVRVSEAILGQRVVDGTVFTLDPIFPSGLTNELPWFYGQIGTKTMGGDDIPALEGARFDFMQSYTPEYGSVNDYCTRMVRGYAAGAFFNMTFIYEGTADNLRDKIIADANEALILKVAKSATHYFQITFTSTQFTTIELKSLKNGSSMATVGGYALKSGANYVAVAVREGFDWS